MKRVEVYVRTDKVGSKTSDILEFPDDIDEEELEWACEQWMLDRIEWGYKDAK